MEQYPSSGSMLLDLLPFAVVLLAGVVLSLTYHLRAAITNLRALEDDNAFLKEMIARYGRDALYWQHVSDGGSFAPFIESLDVDKRLHQRPSHNTRTP